MTVDEVLKKIPNQSPLREIVAQLMDDDSTVREAAYDRFKEIEQRQYDEEEANAILAAATSLNFPELEYDWRNPAVELCDTLWTLHINAYPSLISLARDAYPNVSDALRRSFLVLFSATSSREGAQAIVDCVRESGWPDPYPRVFSEMVRLVEYADVLFPELLLLSKGEVVRALGDVLNRSLEASSLKPSSLTPAMPMILDTCNMALNSPRLTKVKTELNGDSTKNTWMFEMMWRFIWTWPAGCRTVRLMKLRVAS